MTPSLLVPQSRQMEPVRFDVPMSPISRELSSNCCINQNISSYRFHPLFGIISILEFGDDILHLVL